MAVCFDRTGRGAKLDLGSNACVVSNISDQNCGSVRDEYASLLHQPATATSSQ